MEIFLNYLIQFYLNKALNPRPLTPHIIPCYTHKMARYRDHRLRDVLHSMYSKKPVAVSAVRVIKRR